MRLDHLLSKEENEPVTMVRKRQVKPVRALRSNASVVAKATTRYCSILRELEKYGGLAQPGEHLLCKQGVKGSIPLFSTTSVTLDPKILTLVKLKKAITQIKGWRKKEIGRIAQVVRAHA